MSSAGRALLAALSGLLLFASFPPLDLGWLAWIALVPLLIALDGAPPPDPLASPGAGRLTQPGDPGAIAGAQPGAPGPVVGAQPALLGAVAGAVWFIPLMAWMRVFGVLAWVLLAAYLAAYVALFAFLYRWIARGRAAGIGIWTAALLWTALEYLRSIGVFGFPWALLGLTQHAVPAVLRAAAFGGVFSVSFLVVLASAALAHLITRRGMPAAGLALLLVAGAAGWGALALRGVVSEPLLRVAAVQPNVNPREKFDPLAAPEQMRALEGLVVAAGRGARDVIVLPETAIPYDLFGRNGVLREVGGWANRARATLIATSLEGGTANIAVSVAPSGQPLSRYDKVRLVAFGEYGVTPGRRHEPLWTPAGRVGIAVCFESIFPDVTRALVRGGAEVLAVITNDGWFDGTAGIAQHTAHSVLRAVESGRWVVRAANTGRTMIVDPTGRVRASLPLRTASVLPAAVGLVRTDTFYSRWGDLFSQAVLLALLALAFPRLRAAVAADRRLPAFQQASAALILPLLSVWLLLGTRAGWAWPVLVFAFVIVFSAVRSPGSWGFTGRGALVSLGLGTGVVVLLWAGLTLAFRAYGLPTGLPVPAGGWLAGMLRYLTAALALEAWLRGVAFAPLREWKGPVAAVVVTTSAGMLLQRGLGAEAMAWTLVTGVLFGLVRARTGNALGLVLPHAAGAVLFSMVTLVR